MGAALCPKSPIGTYPGGTLYVADYFNPDCDAHPHTAYMFGNYSWPWMMCPDDCNDANSNLRSEGDFPGLPSPVPFEYMHTGQQQQGFQASSRGKTPRYGFPGGPAQYCCRVDAALNSLFLHLNDFGRLRYVKVLQLEVNKELARNQADKNYWDPSYVAFEVSGNPCDPNNCEHPEQWQVMDPIELSDVATPNPFVKRGTFWKGPGQRAEVLILMCR